MRILAILQNMWDPRRTEALNLFTINPWNHTGRKLYRIVGQNELWCTNTSSKCAPNAKVRYAIDLPFLKRAIGRMDWHCVLVCGNQAREAFHEVFRDKEVSRMLFAVPVIFFPHPAARMLTNTLLDAVKEHLIQPGVDWVEFRQHQGSFSKNICQRKRENEKVSGINERINYASLSHTSTNHRQCCR